MARCRLRGLDGVTRKVEKHGRTRTAARQALQEELRIRTGERIELLRRDSRFRDAADVWLGKIRERREDSTLDIDRHWLNKVVLPQLGELKVFECDVAQVDAFFSRLERMRRTVTHKDGTTSEKPHYAASSRRTVRAIVSGVLQQAVLHKAIPSNPTRELERIESPKGHRSAPPRGLTADERRRLLDFVDTNPVAINSDLIRVALGSGLRIGELCALRWMDVNLDGIAVVSADDMRLVPVVAVRQNVYPVKGKGLSVHDGKPRRLFRSSLSPTSSPSASAPGWSATNSPSGRSFPLPGGTASRRTSGHRPFAAGSARSALRSTWTG